MSNALVAIKFPFNELAINRFRFFVRKKAKWDQAGKQWVVERSLWEAFLETLYDAPLDWRKDGYTAPEICDAIDAIRSATVSDAVHMPAYIWQGGRHFRQVRGAA